MMKFPCSVGLLALDGDCLVETLCCVEGEPPEQAITLARAQLTCKALHAAAEQASQVLVHAHLEAAQSSLSRLQRRFEAALPSLRARLPSYPPISSDSLDICLSPPKTLPPLLMLSSHIPMLPLQWTLLHGSQTRLEASEAGWITALEGSLEAVDVKGTARPLLLPDPHAEMSPSSFVRDLPLDLHGFASFALVARLGLQAHPGLLKRWRVGRRQCPVPCPCCSKYRMPHHAAHATWSPDALDAQLNALPATLTPPQRARRSISARDAECLEEEDWESLEQLEHFKLMKCSCDGGGGGFCKYIGIPPWMAEPED
mmetsp:Transcript_62158/g.138457  ORF Transcript_62158/g.138457 Transcript_62158/m.138457 type:complete len:314 (-) Transcript_62158:170-1111(-)